MGKTERWVVGAGLLIVGVMALDAFVFAPSRRAGNRAEAYQQALEHPGTYEAYRGWQRQEVLKDLDRDRERALSRLEERR